jgi:hypothetical protein
MNGDENKDEQMPAGLVDHLRALASKTAVFVQLSVDETVLARARERFAEVRRRRARFTAAWWTAAAASIALMAVVGLSLIQKPHYERADIDRNGRVDILDAFALARRVQQGGVTGPDMNGDGVVNRTDVDIIAAQAVKLKRGRV